MVMEATEGGIGVDKMCGIYRKPLGPGCVNAWKWEVLQNLQFLELGVD